MASSLWLLHCSCLRLLSSAGLPTAMTSGHLTGKGFFTQGEWIPKGLGLEIRKSVNPLNKLSGDSQIWGGVVSPPKSRAAPLQKSLVHFCPTCQRSVLPFPPQAYPNGTQVTDSTEGPGAQHLEWNSQNLGSLNISRGGRR